MAWSEYFLAFDDIGPNNDTFYSPYVDLQGPLFFNPPHCYGGKELPYESPMIAFIKNGNEVEE